MIAYKYFKVAEIAKPTAATDPDKVFRYLNDTFNAVKEFENEIACIGEDIQKKAYPHFVESVKQAYQQWYNKIKKDGKHWNALSEKLKPQPEQEPSNKA